MPQPSVCGYRAQMNSSPNFQGRILRYGYRSDDATDEMVETRARELALIDGRAADRTTDQDRALARDELAGRCVPETSLAFSDAVGELSADPSQPRGLRGTQTPMRNDPEDQETAERLVLEGVDEAAHEQMLAARRPRPDEL